MRTRTMRLVRSLMFGGVLAFGAASGGIARAEADGFGLGDGHSGAKNVVGNEVVNAYAPLAADAAAGATTLETGGVIGTGAFAAGDLVLVWRATGVTPSEAPSGNQTKRLDLATTLATTSTATNLPGLVGVYELARVQAVAGGTLTLTKPLVRGFTKNVSQVVRVPEYTDVTIPAGASVAATAWQQVGAGPGWAGGIVVFLATGTVDNKGVIHANGRGFHGGRAIPRLANLALVCKADDGTPAKGYAEKGEGVVQAAFGPNKGGKGNVSMAGGGGNCIEGGGGGGANLGNGGRGGGAALGIGTGGLGGVGVDYSLLDRMTLGGGGGAGEQKNGKASPGAFGGGVVYIRGNTLTGKGKIQANGDKAENAGILDLPTGVESDGAGGGGAGGSIVLRFVTNADCDGIAGAGGNGGDTAVVGLGIWGPGGGGGGGRVLFQAAAIDPSCKIDVSPGGSGNNGAGGATGGGDGATQPAPSGCSCAPPFCAAATPCADPKPACDTTSGECKACGGPFGSGLPLACPTEDEPVCMTSGDCQPCNGDFASGSTQACQLLASPHCFQSGATQGQCGKCTSDADCTTDTHGGPKCNVVAGVCGTQCNSDADCKATEWCGQNVCIPKTPNSQPVTTVPPFDGSCTPDSGMRTCTSAVCEPDDDLCGLRNGSDCDGKNDRCRSSICFPKDDLCGKPAGEPCAGNGECRSEQCKDGVCTGCDDDSDCPLDRVCDPNKSECVTGCRPGAQPVDGAAVHGLCQAGEICVVPDGGDIGTCMPAGDGGAGDDGGIADAGDLYQAGLVEGGGCSCRTSLASATPPLTIFAGAGAALLFVRRRRRHHR